MTIRFIHLSDTHLGENTLKDDMPPALAPPKPAVSLEATIAHILSLPFSYDFVLHSGDIVGMTRSEADYRVARRLMSRLPAPCYYVLGNHDDGRLFRRIMLGQETSEDAPYTYTFTLKGYCFIALDTRADSEDTGAIDDGQYAWLTARLSSPGAPTLLLMHHNPTPLNYPWMDKMMLRRPEKFWAAIQPGIANGRLRAIFYGHAHQQHCLWRAGLLLSAPRAVYKQLGGWPGGRQFVPALLQTPGYNVVEITADQIQVRSFEAPIP